MPWSGGRGVRRSSSTFPSIQGPGQQEVKGSMVGGWGLGPAWPPKLCTRTPTRREEGPWPSTVPSRVLI